MHASEKSVRELELKLHQCARGDEGNWRNKLLGNKKMQTDNTLKKCHLGEQFIPESSTNSSLA